MNFHTPTQNIFKIIEVLSSHSSLTIDQIIKKTKISYSTTYRILQSCYQLGYVGISNTNKSNTEKKYYLSFKLFHLANTHIYQQLPISEFSQPYLEALSNKVNETVHLGILSNNQVLYINKIDPKHSLRMHSYIGFQTELHCTAMGKVLLAWGDKKECLEIINNLDYKIYTPNTITNKNDFSKYLAKVRKQGFAEDQEEKELYLSCIAVPFFDINGRVVASISVSYLTIRSQHKKKLILDMLWSYGEKISSALQNNNYKKCLFKK